MIEPTVEDLPTEAADVVLDPDWSGQMATRIRRAIDASMNESDRSKWAESNHLGVSDIGTCHEYVRRMILGLPWVDEQDDFAAAFVGTAVGDHVERSMRAVFGDEVEIQRKVTVHLRVRGYELDLPGTADIIVNKDGLLDVKTKDGLGVVRRSGLTQQQVFQLVLYAAALIQEGVLPENPMVGCAFVDRSGREPDPYVFGFRYSQALLDDAIAWLDDVIYAIENGETARKDPPRAWCFKCCPYASDCRGGDTDVEGLLDDGIIRNAVDVYTESNVIIRQAEKDKKSALSILEGISGSTGTHTVRWIDIGPSEVAFTRAGYKRIDIRPIKRKA
jgi:hypothetical protein